MDRNCDQLESRDLREGSQHDSFLGCNRLDLASL